MIQQQVEQMRIAGDIVSIGTVVGTIVGVLPAIAAVFAIFWSVAQLLMNWDKIKAAFTKHFRGK